MRTSFTLPYRRTLWRSLSTFLLLTLSLLLAACGQAGIQAETTVLGTPCPSTTALKGSGSTFDAPLFSKMFAAYTHVPCVPTVSYLADGSGAGLNDLLQQNVDFAATDVPLTDAALSRSQRGPILHIPVTLGSEAIIYHVLGVPSQLRLTGSVLADIFLGKITAWNDPAIVLTEAGRWAFSPITWRR